MYDEKNKKEFGLRKKIRNQEIMTQPEPSNFTISVHIIVFSSDLQSQ